MHGPFEPRASLQARRGCSTDAPQVGTKGATGCHESLVGLGARRECHADIFYQYELLSGAVDGATAVGLNAALEHLRGPAAAQGSIGDVKAGVV